MKISISGSLIDKCYAFSLFLFSFFVYIFPRDSHFLLRIIPLVLGLLLYSLFFLRACNKLKKRDAFIVFMMGLLVLWILLRVFFQVGLAGLASLEVFYFLSWPFMFVSLYRLIARQDFLFLNIFLVFFLVFEALIVLGQLSNSLFGVGFHRLSDYSDMSYGERLRYSNMLSGTFFNSNDLASSVILVVCYFYVVKDKCSRFFSVAMILAFFLLVAAISRSMLLMFFVVFFYFYMRDSLVRSIVFVFLIFWVLFGFYLLGSYFEDYEAVRRVISRVDSILLVIENGLLSDYSLWLRLNSYLFFFENFWDVGFGTGEYKDYSFFFRGLSSDFLIFAESPHSFFIEVCYWLGYPGFLLVIVLFVSLGMRKACLDSLFVFFVFFVVGFVSSSIIGRFLLIYCFFACILAIKNGRGPLSESPTLKLYRVVMTQ